MKLTELIKQLIKESINELSDTSSGVSKFLKYAKKHFDDNPKKDFLKFPSYKALHDYISADNGKDFDELKKELILLDPNWDKEEIDEAFFIGEDDIDEYDVENVDDMKEFLQFMKEYKQTLAEAECGCVYEAEYKGRKVQLGKPMQGDIKKFKVYVKNPKGKVVKVNFGFGGSSAHGKRMNIKKNNPKRRKAYRARHHCDNPGPRHKANYWSCRKW